MKTLKKILTLTLILAGIFVFFKVATPALAQYGFQRLFGVPGLEQASVGEIIVRAIQWIMAIIGLICVAFIIYGGVMYATSGGNEEHITRGKKILLWSIVGLIICILAFTIASAVVGMIGGEGGGTAGRCYASYEGPWFAEPNAKTECERHLRNSPLSDEDKAYCWCGTYGVVGQKLYCRRQQSDFNSCRTWCRTIINGLGSYPCGCDSCK